MASNVWSERDVLLLSLLWRCEKGFLVTFLLSFLFYLYDPSLVAFFLPLATSLLLRIESPPKVPGPKIELKTYCVVGILRQTFKLATPKETRERSGPCLQTVWNWGKWGLMEYKWKWFFLGWLVESKQAVVPGRLSLIMFLWLLYSSCCCWGYK